MNILEYLDRAGQRRIERLRLIPQRPRDTKLIVATLFFMGYYGLVYLLMTEAVPGTNANLVRDAMLVLGPVIGGIGQAIFRNDVRDEIAATNTGEGFKALAKQAEAVSAAAAAPGGDASRAAAQAADKVAGAAGAKRDEIKGDD